MKIKKLIAPILCACLAAAFTFTANANISIQYGGGEYELKYISGIDGSTPCTNLAQKEGTTISGDNWATGDNRGLDMLNNGKMNTSAGGDSEGWIINYDTANAKGDEGIRVNINFAAAEDVSTMVVVPSIFGNDAGNGMPARFKIVGTLENGEEVTLYDHSSYDYIVYPGILNFHRFNFAPTKVTSISFVCLAPSTQIGGNAMNDANIAYWMTEIMVFDDTKNLTGEGNPLYNVNVNETDNLAFEGSLIINYNSRADRPNTDLNNGALGSFGNFILFNNEASGYTPENPNTILLQFGSVVTADTLTMRGGTAPHNGIPKSFRLRAIAADGVETIIYDTANAANYPDVTVENQNGQPQKITFPNATFAKLCIETWEWYPSNDGNVACWFDEIEIYNAIADDNTGDDNTGDDNTGDDNTGDDNTGDDNTGGDNTGDDNTGDDDQEAPDTGYVASVLGAFGLAASAGAVAITSRKRSKK